MTGFKLDIRGLDKALAKVGDIKALNRKLRPTMEQATHIVHDEIATYPRKAPGAFTAEARPRQRRAYWARVRAGEIRHGPNGYIRSGNTARGWTTQVKGVRTLTGIIGNNQPAAKWVHSAEHQQAFHRISGFKTDKQAVENKRAEIERRFEIAVKRIIDS